MHRFEFTRLIGLMWNLLFRHLVRPRSFPRVGASLGWASHNFYQQEMVVKTTSRCGY